MTNTLMIATYYLCILTLLAPWWLLFFGSIQRVRQRGGRLRRFQVEGAFLALAGTMAKWIVYDIHFGFDRLNVTLWGYWFSRGEVGFLLVGLLMFGLGSFLERKPGSRTPSPWPETVKKLSGIAILSGVALCLVTFSHFKYAWFELPWLPWRVFLTLGVLPFSIGYVVFGKQNR
jgi:hypothetical protein